MCGKYGNVTKLEELERKLNAKLSFPDAELPQQYVVNIGDLAPVITQEQPNSIQLFQFGLTPSWATKKMYLFNARAEGDHNKENNPNINSPKGIISKPSFRVPIRKKRCLIPSTHFFEGSEKEGLSKPFLVHLRKKEDRPFFFAGIYDTWIDKTTGEISNGFSIITTVANSLLKEGVRHHRSPVIIPKGYEREYLKPDIHLGHITSMLEPYDWQLMDAYPIDATLIKGKDNNHKETLNPLGESLMTIYDREERQREVAQLQERLQKAKDQNDYLATRVTWNVKKDNQRQEEQ